MEVPSLLMALNNTNNESYPWTDSFILLTDTGSTKWMEDVCRQQSGQHPRRNSFSYMETCAISIQSCWSNFKRNWAFTTFDIYTMVERTTMTFTGAISWPATEVNTPTENLEIKNVHVALLQPPEDITQRFSKLNKLIRVIAYCRRFNISCRHPRANRQLTSWRLRHASNFITNGKSTGLIGHWRTLLEIHPTTWTSLQRTGMQ